MISNPIQFLTLGYVTGDSADSFQVHFADGDEGWIKKEKVHKMVRIDAIECGCPQRGV